MSQFYPHMPEGVCPVFDSMLPVWIAYTARKVGTIPANTQITNLWDFSRQSSRFSDWLENNNLPRAAIKLRRGYIGGGHFCNVHWGRE